MVVGSIPVPVNAKIKRLRVLVLARLERPQTNPAKTSDQETAGSIPAEISANGARVVVCVRWWQSCYRKHEAVVSCGYRARGDPNWGPPDTPPRNEPGECSPSYKNES